MSATSDFLVGDRPREAHPWIAASSPAFAVPPSDDRRSTASAAYPLAASRPATDLMCVGQTAVLVDDEDLALRIGLPRRTSPRVFRPPGPAKRDVFRPERRRVRRGDAPGSAAFDGRILVARTRGEERTAGSGAEAEAAASRRQCLPARDVAVRVVERDFFLRGIS